MVRLYFQYFESAFRIFHAPTFWTRYQRYWDNPEATSVNLRLEILLAIAIGSSVHNHGSGETDFRNMVHQWVYAAQTWLSGPLEKDRLNITGIQIHCLTIIARQIFCLGADLVWASLGLLVHSAMQIGLHRDPRHLSNMTVLQAEIRRRLWGTILELTVQSSLDAEMPPRIHFDEFDTEPPSNSNDDEIADSTTVLQLHSEDQYTTTSVQLILLRSLRTRHRIVQLLNGITPDIAYAEILTLSSDLTKALGSCSALAYSGNESIVNSFRRNMLDYMIRRFLLHLHLPFACRARTTPLLSHSSRIALDTAVTLISPEPDECFYRLMVIGGGMLRDGIRYAGVPIGLELLAHTEAQRLDLTLHRNSDYRSMLKRALEKMIATSAQRIQHGESNVKNHMFLSMMVADAGAIEKGDSRDLKIAQSARSSLQLCHDLLRAQSGTASVPWYDHMETTNLSGEWEDHALDFDFGIFLQGIDFP
ncbi:hypothetical protein LTR37_001800 [Vermiconidia calcicola]|uniref:Uncharacterized protein n=1 Tax=Vermiconidia calcicola TaxID=1690605 RepID=A0ACC3NV92_9PEZI|nr:hypothetical protein LTR37_001800 [Vermiconidia calcicola]